MPHAAGDGVYDMPSEAMRSGSDRARTTGPTIPDLRRRIERLLETLDRVRRHDDVAVHQQDPIGAAGQRLADADVHAARESEIAAGVDVR